MFTKEELKAQILAMGILPTDTVLVHSSLRAIGPTENGADGIIDAFFYSSVTAKYLVAALDAI